MSKFAVILPAAGKSSRFGGEVRKPFLPLNGRPVWLRCAELFLNRPDVARILVVVSAEDRDEFTSRYGGNLVFMDLRLVTGGAERFESVANALAEVGPDVEYVAVHDAVRPLAGAGLIDAVFAAAREHGAALPAVPLADTLKRVDAGMLVTETPPRDGLWLAQTPQVARRDWLEEAYRRRSEFPGPITDDAQLLAAAGFPVRVVPGEVTNLKLTTPQDMLLAEAIVLGREDKVEPGKSRRPFDDDWD